MVQTLKIKSRRSGVDSQFRTMRNKKGGGWWKTFKKIISGKKRRKRRRYMTPIDSKSHSYYLANKIQDLETSLKTNITTVSRNTSTKKEKKLE